MSLYEILMLAIAIIQLIIDIITRRLRRRKKGKRIKKIAPPLSFDPQWRGTVRKDVT